MSKNDQNIFKDISELKIKIKFGLDEKIISANP